MGVLCPAAIAAILFSASVSIAGDAADVARQQRTEARGWLQLERDQTVNRERVGPLSPPASRGLEIRERMERGDRRALDLRQRQHLQAQQRKDRLARSSGESRPAARATDLRHRRQSDQLRLRMRVDRDIRRPHRSPTESAKW